MARIFHCAPAGPAIKMARPSSHPLMSVSECQRVDREGEVFETD